MKNETTGEWVEVANPPAITSSAVYSDNGNYLLSTTDAAGNITTYGYDPQTNVLNWVQYPNDTETSRTAYSYDAMYRLASAQAQTGNQTLTAAYTYENDLLTQITTGSTTYNFGYGNFGLRTDIKIGELSETNSGITLATYEYAERTNYLKKLAYGNADMVEYAYDDLGRVIEQEYEDGDTVTYQYDNNGALATMTDSATGRKTTYYYDFTDRLMKYVESGTGYHHSVGYEYDTLNNLTTLVETINGVDRTTSYEYDGDNRVETITIGSVNRGYTYDRWGRVYQRITNYGDTPILTETLGYRSPSASATTGQVESLATVAANYNVTYTYTYDNNGNILTVSDGTNTTTYTYDTQNQLIREDNQAAGKTWRWTYDDAGNILSKTESNYRLGNGPYLVTDTVSYSYGNSNWGDLLTAYDGKLFLYDTIGNPISDGNWTYSWEHGRQLASMTKGSTSWTYTYDANGMRTRRTDGTTTHDYVYNGSQLVQQVITSIPTSGTTPGNPSVRSVATTDTLNYYYDAAGMPLYVDYNGTVYYYATNIQGDVMALLDSNGIPVVKYSYDAWGNILTTTGALASTLGQDNSLRYRGYVYDQQTGLYYLQSRYYDPEIGRFLNADALASTGNSFVGYNMFAYCCNNPTNYYDPTGYGVVGLGVQLDVSIGGYECGIEIVVYWDETVCEGGGPVVAIYVYEGATISISNLINDPNITYLIDQLTLALIANAGKDYDTMALIELQALLFGTDISGSVLAIWGYENFTCTEDYEGLFSSYSGTIDHAKATWSYSPKCWAIAIGATTHAGIDVSFSMTNYTQIYSSLVDRTGAIHTNETNHRFSFYNTCCF